MDDWTRYCGCTFLLRVCKISICFPRILLLKVEFKVCDCQCYNFRVDKNSRLKFWIFTQKCIFRHKPSLIYASKANLHIIPLFYNFPSSPTYFSVLKNVRDSHFHFYLDIIQANTFHTLIRPTHIQIFFSNLNLPPL